MIFYDRSSSASTRFRGGAWETGIIRGASVLIDGQQVVGQRAAAIDSPTGGTVVDSEARATIDALLDTLRGHGLIES